MRTLTLCLLLGAAVVASVAKSVELDDEDNFDMVNACYRQLKYEGEKLQDISWANRQFTCFHACMMEQRGEMTDGKVQLDKYIENHVTDYNPHADDSSKLHIIECALAANEQEDKCLVAGSMGKCVTEKWHLIVNEG